MDDLAYTFEVPRSALNVVSFSGRVISRQRIYSTDIQLHRRLLPQRVLSLDTLLSDVWMEPQCMGVQSMKFDFLTYVLVR